MKGLTKMVLSHLPLRVSAAAGSPDESFYREAAESGLAEVEQGQLAREKGQAQAVKDVGDMMVQDHSAAVAKLRALATAKGIELPDSPSAAQVASIEHLRRLSGDVFDRSFIRHLVREHEVDMDAFKEEARTGLDPDARGFATAVLPTLQKHFENIRSVASAVAVEE
jgi:putative membrane protein